MEAFQYALQLFHSGGLVMYPLLLLSIFTPVSYTHLDVYKRQG